MIQLAFEGTLRKALGFAAIRQDLFGKTSACLFAGEASLPRFEKALELGAHQIQQECRSLLSEAKGDWLRIVDDLLAHGKFEAAKDFCLFLDSDPETSRSADFSATTMHRLFLRLKAVQCALEGGLYQRARSCLAQAGHLATALASGVTPQALGLALLLEGNLLMLWGRFYQLQHHPDEPIHKLSDALECFRKGGWDEPPGYILLLARSEMDRVNGLNVAEALLERALRESADALETSVYASYTLHYTHYLVSRLAFLRGDYAKSLDAVDASRQALRAIPHAGAIDGTRNGWLDLLEARAYSHIATSPSGTAAHPRTATRMFFQARTHFAAGEFVPGEYFAVSYYAEMLAASGSESTTQLLALYKEAARLARQAGAPGFEIQARQSASLLYLRLGRLDGAYTEAKRVLHLFETRNVCPSRDHLAGIQQAARDTLSRSQEWETNAVLPDKKWGVSEYAEKEQQFVVDAAHGKAACVVAGSSEGFPFLLARRIHALRGRDPNLLLRIQRRLTSRADVMKELCKQTKETGFAVEAFDLLPWEAQEAVVESEHKTNLYLILSDSWAECSRTSRLAPRVAAALGRRCFEVQPLQRRVSDALPLARGFLVQWLLARGVTSEVERSRIRRLSFSGQAAGALTQIVNRRRPDLHGLEQLNEAMRDVALRLNMETDVAELPDGRCKITFEALTREESGWGLRISERHDFRLAQLLQDRRAKASAYGTDIVKAPIEVVKRFAEDFDGNLKALALAAGVRRTTLVKHWTASGRLKIWRAVGRKTHPSSEFTSE